MKVVLAIFFFINCFDAIHAMNDSAKKQQPKENILALVNSQKNIIDLDKKDVPLETLLQQVDTLYKCCDDFIREKVAALEFLKMLQTGFKLSYISLCVYITNIFENSFLKDIAMQDSFEYKKNMTSSLMQCNVRLHDLYKRYITIIKSESSMQTLINDSDIKFLLLQKAAKEKIIEYVFS